MTTCSLVSALVYIVYSYMSWEIVSSRYLSRKVPHTSSYFIPTYLPTYLPLFLILCVCCCARCLCWLLIILCMLDGRMGKWRDEDQSSNRAIEQGLKINYDSRIDCILSHCLSSVRSYRCFSLLLFVPVHGNSAWDSRVGRCTDTS